MPATIATALDGGMHPQDADMLAAYLEHLRRLNRSDDTISGRERILCALDRALPRGLGEAADDELAAWIYGERLAPNSRATYLTAARSLYRWAVKAEWVSVDPTTDLESVRTAKGIARPCTDEQLEILLTRPPDYVRVWMRLAAYQGLRCIEISGLMREHVTAERLVVVRGKGGRPRVHDTDPGVWATVKDLPLGPLARTRAGRRASASHISQRGKYWASKFGVDVTMHQLRHWLGCTVQAQYRDARVTMELLGHNGLSATSIYTQATLDQQRQARATLPRLA
jgi:integrase/recombinase XerC